MARRGIIGSIFVKLGLDGMSSFGQDLDRAKDKAQTTADDIGGAFESAGQKIEDSSKGVRKFAGAISGLVGVISALAGAFFVAEKAMRGVLSLTEKLSGRFRDLAAAADSTGDAGVEATVRLRQQLETELGFIERVLAEQAGLVEKQERTLSSVPAALAAAYGKATGQTEEFAKKFERLAALAARTAGADARGRLQSELAAEAEERRAKAAERLAAAKDRQASLEERIFNAQQELRGDSDRAFAAEDRQLVETQLELIRAQQEGRRAEADMLRELLELQREAQRQRLEEERRAVEDRIRIENEAADRRRQADEEAATRMARRMGQEFARAAFGDINRIQDQLRSLTVSVQQLGQFVLAIVERPPGARGF